MQQKIDDEKAWIQGRYILDAFETVMSHFGAGLSGKTSHAKYVEKPFLMQMKEEGIGESNEEVAVFEMKKRTKFIERSGLEASPM